MLPQHAPGISSPLFATTNGETIWTFRYSSEGDSRSLNFSTRMDELKLLYPESEELARVGIVQPGWDELRPFTPRA